MDASIKVEKVNGKWEVSKDHLKLGKDTGAHVITFDIVDNPQGAKFAKDPIWIQMDTKPTQKPPPGAEKNQIGAWKLMNNDQQLVVVDWNDAPGTLHYALNFSDGTKLDPVIENGGGIKPPGSLMMWADYVSFAVVALVAFALGLLVYKRFFAR